MTMTFDQILIICNGILLTVAGYFIKQTMERLAKLEVNCQENSKEIDLVRQENNIKHDYTSKEFKELRDSIKELNSTIKELNNRLPKE